MKPIALALAIAGAVAAGAVLAQSADDLLKSKGCLGCHSFDKKKVGPAFNDVAAKHKGNAQAEAALVAKLKDGKGHPKINASEADVKTMVGRVLKGN
jgi:cytochrome c